MKLASMLHQLEKIPSIGIIPELVTGIISSITHALSKLLESCVNIAIKHENKESVSQLEEQSGKLDKFANKYNLPNAKEPARERANLMETSQSEPENKQSLTKKQKIDDKVSEAGEMISEFGPLINEVCQSLATIPGVGTIAMLIGSIAGPIVSGLGELIEKLASIDSQASTNSKEQDKSTLSPMSETKTETHDSASILDFPTGSQKESNVNISNDINSSDIQEPVGFAVQ